MSSSRHILWTKWRRLDIIPINTRNKVAETMAALEPARKRPTTFTIESIVGRSSPSPAKPGAASRSRHVDESSSPPDPHGRRSASWKPTPAEPGSTCKATSTTAVLDGSRGSSAGQHLELLARYAAPNLHAGAFSTPSGIFGGGGGAGVSTVAEALLQAGRLPYSAVELTNGGGKTHSTASFRRLCE